MQKIVNPATPVTSMAVIENWMHKETLETTLNQGGFMNVEILETEPIGPRRNA